MCLMKTALTCLAMLAFLGCSGDPKSNSPASAPAFDPVADYTKFIDSEIKRVENIKCSFHEGKIDVQKTDSLVSPLAGSYNCKVWVQMDLELGKVVAFYEVEMSHGRQGDK